MVISEIAGTRLISPSDVVPGARAFRQLPVNELGAADFEALLTSAEIEEQHLEALRGLLADVAMDRIVHPVIVRPAPERAGRYELVSGWLVWSAALYLQKEAVQALVWHGDDLEALALSYRLNHHRVQMKRNESARMASEAARLLSDGSDVVGYRDVARALGCSVSWAHKLLSAGRPGEDSLNEPEEAGKRRRGRPPVALVFSFQMLDPRRWESSVRLRAVLQGNGERKELKFQRSEESEGWHDVALDDFIAALVTEIERLQNWLAVMSRPRNGNFPEEKSGRFPRLDGRPPAQAFVASNGLNGNAMKGRHANPHM